MLDNGRFVFRALAGIPAFNYQLANGNNERQMFADGDGELRVRKDAFPFPARGKGQPARENAGYFRRFPQIAARDAAPTLARSPDLFIFADVTKLRDSSRPRELLLSLPRHVVIVKSRAWPSTRRRERAHCCDATAFRAMQTSIS